MIHKLYIENILIKVITRILLSPVIKNPISISGNRMDKPNYSIFLLQIDNTENDIIFQIIFQKTSTSCWKIFGTDDVVWYWQLYYCSKMTIVSLLCSTIALCTFLCLRPSTIFILNMHAACAGTSVSRRLNILSMNFKIGSFCMTSCSPSYM